MIDLSATRGGERHVGKFNLANKPSYAKEAYMMTLHPFVENNKARINQFLNNLCEVGDFYETLEVCHLPRNGGLLAELDG